jgi:hypothetical protein
MYRWLLLAAALCQAAEPKPEIVSLLTLVTEQNLIENLAAVLSGNVESVSWEQIRVDRDASGDGKDVLLHSRLTRYDADHHVVEETERQSGGETRSKNVYENGLLVKSTGRSFRADGKQVGEEGWQTWKYDDAGRLLETKRGQGEKLQNHDVSSYDASGRLIRREIRQGNTDAIVFTELYTYSGKPEVMQRRILTPQTGVTRDSFRLRVNDAGKVTESWSDEDGYHVRWKYDEQNRVVEQLTDQYKPKAGCDGCPLPGTVQARYQGATREQTFLEPGGKPVFQRVTTFEKDGSIASIRYQLPEGASPQDARDLNRVVGAIVPQGGEQHVVTTWDDHGNWTEKKVVFEPRTGAAITRFIYRRKIVYR